MKKKRNKTCLKQKKRIPSMNTMHQYEKERKICSKNEILRTKLEENDQNNHML